MYTTIILIRSKGLSLSHPFAFWIVATTDVVLHIVVCSISYNSDEFPFGSCILLKNYKNHKFISARRENQIMCKLTISWLYSTLKRL